MEMMGIFLTILFIVLPIAGALFLMISLLVYNWNGKIQDGHSR